MNKWTFRKDLCPIYEDKNTVAGKISNGASLKLTTVNINLYSLWLLLYECILII